MKINSSIMESLAQRKAGQITTAAIIARFGVTASVISTWAHQLGMQPLKRGRKTAVAPSQRHLQILMAVRSDTYERVGARYNISKQRVFSIVRRWKNFPLPQLLDKATPALTCSTPTASATLKKEIRPYVISFRLTHGEMNSLRCHQPVGLSNCETARDILTKALEFLGDVSISQAQSSEASAKNSAAVGQCENPVCDATSPHGSDCPRN